MNKAACKIAIILLVLSCSFSSFAQQRAGINSDFLLHLKSHNLELERFAYYKTVDFSQSHDTALTKDICYLSSKFQDTTLVKQYHLFARDSNDLVYVFYAASLLQLNQIKTNVYKDLARYPVSQHQLFQLAELSNLLVGKLSKENYTKQFEVTTERIKKLEKKSIFLATVFSLLLPGSGKYYLMQHTEATSALVLNLIAAAPLVECVIKLGLLSTGTIITGLVFIPVYAASVYGTIKSKKLLLNKLNIQLKNEVLDYCAYQLHH